MLTSASNTTVLGCYFEDNYSFDGRGGAIYHSGDWQDFSTSYLLTVHDSTFFDNRASWTDSPSALQTLSVLDQGNGYELVTVREIPPPTPRTSCFGRIEITRTAP